MTSSVALVLFVAYGDFDLHSVLGQELSFLHYRSCECDCSCGVFGVVSSFVVYYCGVLGDGCICCLYSIACLLEGGVGTFALWVGHIDSKSVEV